MNDFQSWDAGLHSGDHNYLEQHGIPGMHWHVRKYQNEDGSLTPAGRARYGVSVDTVKAHLDKKGVKKTSARKMQRDFNRLDKGYANVVAEKDQNVRRFNKATKKAEKYATKKGLIDKNGRPLPNKKLLKLAGKVKKAGEKVQENDRQIKGIENLQWKILAKAREAGYTTKSKAVYRTGTTRRARGMAAISGMLVGGAVGGAITGVALGSSAKRVMGQKVKIRKNGDGKTQVVNYRTGQKESVNFDQRTRQKHARKKAG